jgi:hypothetical protein
MKIKLDQKSARRVVQDNIRTWRVMQHVWVVLPVSTWKVWVPSIVWIVILEHLKMVLVQRLVKLVVQDNIKMHLAPKSVWVAKLGST